MVYTKTCHSLIIFITSHFVVEMCNQRWILSLCCEIDAHLNISMVDWDTFLISRSSKQRLKIIKIIKKILVELRFVYEILHIQRKNYNQQSF